MFAPAGNCRGLPAREAERQNPGPVLPLSRSLDPKGGRGFLTVALLATALAVGVVLPAAAQTVSVDFPGPVTAGRARDCELGL